MKTLIEFILNRLVDYPEEVVVDEIDDGDIWRYTITVHPDDVGRVIGKQGSVINAIRTIAKIKAIKDGERVHIEVLGE